MGKIENDARPVVVIGFAESLSAPEVAWSLADEGFKVTAFARAGSRAALRFSRYVSVFEIMTPETNAFGALGELNQHLEKLQKANTQTGVAVMALDDASVWLCAR